jgi:hypothetical protein
MDKPTLLKLCRDRGVTATVDGVPLKGNTLKSELVAALEAQTDAPTPEPAAETPTPARTPAPTPDPEPAKPEPVAVAANPQRTQVTEAGPVDTATGELLQASAATPTEAAIATVADTLGGVVIAEPAPDVPTPPVTGAPAPVADGPACEICGKPLSEENPDLVKLAWIKYRKRLCGDDYAARKSAGR